MAIGEKEKVFASELKQAGIFDFKEFYLFAYNWIKDELNIEMAEKKYIEKVKSPTTKKVEVKWEGDVEMTDYFKFDLKVEIEADDLEKIQIQQGGAKVDTNKGRLKVKITGSIIRDYKGKFEKTAIEKFLRTIYEKWVIPARVDEYKNKTVEGCDNLLGQLKAWLDLEGKR